jgi:hypothetical protein
MNFIEIEGASGAQYRFRLLPESTPHPPMPGNYAFVRRDRNRLTVMVVGETIDLSKVRADWPAAARQGATHIFTRLNVPRAVRTAEHQDMAARYATSPILHAAE